MVKRLMLIAIFALVIGLIVPAYAEVQNIKVSGDILMQGVSRDRMDLSNGASNEHDDMISSFLSAVRLRIDADLTENVQAAVRLLNERNWSEETSTSTDIDLDLAYVTMKEFLYSPLTLVLGRQNLRYGNAFIVGDPDTNQFSEYDHYSATQTPIIQPVDLSVRKAFDAVRAILNYDPLVIDLVYAKIDEGTVLSTSSAPETDDVDLYGVNVAYDFGTSKDIMSEAYLFVKNVSTDGHTGGATSTSISTGTVQVSGENDIIYTIGTKASLTPIERMYLSGEVAWQLGDKFVSDGDEALTRDRKAMAFQIITQYALDMKYSPVLTAQFTHYSGEKNPGSSPYFEKGDYEAWDPMFEDQAGGKIYNALFGATNENIAEVKISVVPIEDLTLSLEYANLWLDKALQNETVTWDPNDYTTNYNVYPGKKSLAQEVDLVLTYDYTEDVQFGLNTGVLIPGPVFKTNNETCTQLIGSVKVSF